MTATTKQSLVLNADDLVTLLNLSKPTVHKLIKNGTIPSIRLGKRILIPRKALDKLLEGS